MRTSCTVAIAPPSKGEVAVRNFGMVPCGDIVAIICSLMPRAMERGRLQSKYDAVEIDDGADDDVSIGRDEIEDDG